jgi:hypothetical protein
MSASSVSRFYAAIDVDSEFSQQIESLFNSFIATQACNTGWHVDLQNSSADYHMATITDPEGIAKSYAIPTGVQSDFSDHLLTHYREYAVRKSVVVDGNRQTKMHTCTGNVNEKRLLQWRHLVRTSLRTSAV